MSINGAGGSRGLFTKIISLFGEVLGEGLVIYGGRGLTVTQATPWCCLYIIIVHGNAQWLLVAYHKAIRLWADAIQGPAFSALTSPAPYTDRPVWMLNFLVAQLLL